MSLQADFIAILQKPKIYDAAINFKPSYGRGEMPTCDRCGMQNLSRFVYNLFQCVERFCFGKCFH